MSTDLKHGCALFNVFIFCFAVMMRLRKESRVVTVILIWMPKKR